MSFWNGSRWNGERSVGQLPSSSRTRRLSLREWLATIPIVLLVPALISPLFFVGADSGDRLGTVVGTVASQVQTPAPAATPSLAPAGPDCHAGLDGHPRRDWDAGRIAHAFLHSNASSDADSDARDDSESPAATVADPDPHPSEGSHALHKADQFPTRPMA